MYICMCGRTLHTALYIRDTSILLRVYGNPKVFARRSVTALISGAYGDFTFNHGAGRRRGDFSCSPVHTDTKACRESALIFMRVNRDGAVTRDSRGERE